MASLAAFWNELRRRRVVRVAIVYIIASIAVVETANNFFPVLQLPGWTTTLIAALALLGFPVAIGLAWAFDITPHGVTRTVRTAVAAAPADDSAAPAPRASHAVPVTSRPDDGVIRSLVVLPFVNVSRDGADEYLSDGVTEELIGALARVPNLRVAARTSSFVFKGQPLDVREIAARLGVDGVMEGSVRRAGARIRIHATLLSASDGHHRWSGAWDYEMDDALRLQEEVSREVVDALRQGGIDLAAPALNGVTSRNGRAWDLYLQGRYWLNRRTEEGLAKAVDLFGRAAGVDAQYALAHAGLAEASVLSSEYGVLSPREAIHRATSAAERALALAPDLPEALVARALAHVAAWEWSAADSAFRRALELQSDHAVACHRHALLLAWLLRHDDALRTMQRAVQLDPVSPVARAGLAWVHYHARRFDDAAAASTAVLDSDADFLGGWVILGLARLAAGETEAAVRALETACRMSGDAPTVLPLLGLAAGRAGNSALARAIRERTLARRLSGYAPAYYEAIAMLGVDDHDGALRALEAAVVEHAGQMAYLLAEPALDPLRPKSRFQHIVAAVGLA